jgi:hypothetical protein
VNPAGESQKSPIFTIELVVVLLYKLIKIVINKQRWNAKMRYLAAMLIAIFSTSSSAEWV